MKIVAFLQNQWWRDPEGVKKRIANHATPEEFRRRLIVWGLQGCKTGRVLEKRLASVIGPISFKKIHWENSSREIGGKSASSFPANIEHMEKVINKQLPDVILVFGKIAQQGLNLLTVAPHIAILEAVHPASRGSLLTLDLMAMALKVIIASRKRTGARKG